MSKFERFGKGRRKRNGEIYKFIASKISLLDTPQ